MTSRVKIDDDFVMNFEDSKPWGYFQCDLCQTKNMNFVTSKDLRSHLATEHFRDIILSNINMELRQKPICPKCLDHFESFDTLLVHREEMHTG